MICISVCYFMTDHKARKSVKGRRCSLKIVLIATSNSGVPMGYPVPMKTIIAPLTVTQLQEYLSVFSLLSRCCKNCTARTVNLLCAETLCTGKDSTPIPLLAITNGSSYQQGMRSCILLTSVRTE